MTENETVDKNLELKAKDKAKANYRRPSLISQF